MSTVNTHLLVAIREQRMRQCEIARLAEIEESMLSRILNGWREPSDDQKARIAEALDMPVEDLFPEVEPETQAA